MDAEEHLARILRLLQGSIRAAGYTQTEVDERIGRRRGYLSHVFQRRVDLKLHDLLRALEMLEIDPSAFFHAALSGRGGEHPALEDLMQLVTNSKQRGLPSPAATQPPGATAEDPRLVERVRAIVRDLLTSSPEAGEAKPPAGRPPDGLDADG